MKRLVLGIGALLILSLFAAACGDTQPEVVERVVTVEVPGETIVETVTEVVEVEVPGETIIETVTEVVEVEVPGETIIQTVTEVVEVPVEVIVTETVTTTIEVPVQFVSFGEAPALLQKVQGGLLEPVEDRLPLEPMVIPVFEEIGRYGGTIHGNFLGRSDYWAWGRLNKRGLARHSVDGSTIVPALAKGWEVTTDQKTWTFFLREGTKWSDGTPLTADDFLFFYEDIILNDELAPGKPGRWKGPDAELGTFEKVDDYTIKYTFSAPNAVFLETITQMDSSGGTNGLFAPAHYLKQFHLKYNADAEADAQAAGFGNWVQYFFNRMEITDNPQRPVTTPWIPTTDFSSTRLHSERNPYFYAVDPEGNQLPYADELVFDLVETVEVINLNAIAGDLDFQSRHINYANFTVFKENEEQGGYRTLVWPNAGGNETMLMTHMTYKGEDADVFTPLINMKKFRQALSMAIDRDSINETSFFGTGEGRQMVPLSESAMYPGDSCAFKYMYDQDMANQFLNEIVPDRDTAGFRTYNGKRINLVITTTADFTLTPDVAEQIAEDWKAVGLDSKADVVARSLFSERRNAETAQFSMFEDSSNFPFTYHIFAPMTTWIYWGPSYGSWFVSGGTEGIEPPDVEEQQALIDLVQRGMGASQAERDEIGKELFQRHCENLYYIGIIGRTPVAQGIVIASDELRNVPEVAFNDWPARPPATSYPEQFFFKRQ